MKELLFIVIVLIGFLLFWSLIILLKYYKNIY